jgi:two-component system sensor histidine kinase RpfC
MDLHMPVMTGIEAAKLYRFISLGERRVPILALTVDATLETAARCAEAGMDGCVTKPVEPARLLEAINEAVSRQESTSQPAITASEQVMDIASHQRFQPANQAAFDRGTLAGFEALGGRSFLAGLIHDFIADSELLLADLVRAAEAEDIRLFRARCYALQTAADTVGGEALRDLCIDIRKIRPLPVNQGLVNRIAREFDRLRHALLQYCGADDETRMLTFRSKSAPYAPTTGRSALLIKRITRMTDNAG